MNPLNPIGLFILALASGSAGALLGIGGGIFLVPLMVFLLGIPMQKAAGASIIAVIATSSAATVTYIRDELTNIRLGMFLELATTLGAVSGAVLVSFVSEETLRFVFGLSLIYASISMYKKNGEDKDIWSPSSNDNIAERFDLGGHYYDEAIESEVIYGVSNTPLTFGLSYIAGIISGLLGIGGGGIKVPALNTVGGVPIKASIATSNFMIGVTAAASALVYIGNGYCDVFLTAPIVLGTLIGAGAGACITNKFSSDSLNNALIVVLLLMAARMILSGVDL